MVNAPAVWCCSQQRAILLYCSENSVSKRDVTHTKWPTLGICALHLTHPRCTHTAVNKHTMNTHPEQWAAMQQHLCCSAQGAVEGSVPCSRATQSWYWRWRALYIYYPHLQFLSAWDSILQPFAFESNSLTIRPQLPQKWKLKHNW